MGSPLRTSQVARVVGAGAGLAMLAGLPGTGPSGAEPKPATTTPIQHLVVIFQENVSFDHYFGTYPAAANTSGQPFAAAPGTPAVNGLTPELLTANPNKDAGGNTANPRRYDPANINDLLTCDQDHNYNDEQRAFDNGAMDKFVTTVGTGSGTSPTHMACNPRDVMNYYDGNSVTGMWNYAQHYAMSDNSYDTTFGPSSPGAINLVSGDTGNVDTAHEANSPSIATTAKPNADLTPDGSPGGYSLTSDAQPYWDDCSNPSRPTLSMSGRNIGDLLNARSISWGWFQGGFRPTGVNASGKAVCGAVTANVGGANIPDYSPHHQPFQYYASTANPHHLAPASTAEIGNAGPANHQYDLADFWAAAQNGTLPAVSFLKAKEAQDGHAGYSDPLDEQQFIVDTINRLEQLPSWSSTAVIIAYDDSDGWYDHVMGPILSQSADAANDALDGAGLCGMNSTGIYQDRCGFGPRLPLLVISPWAKQNFVDHTLTNQSSILRFIEDNWQTGQIGDDSFDAKSGSLNGMFDFSNHSGTDHTRALFLDPATGLVVTD